jgi:hypothetical protein
MRELTKLRRGNLRREVRRLVGSDAKASIARERLRRRYRPDGVRILFVGEAPPASGRFFYQADSGLYRAVRDTFVCPRACPRENPAVSIARICAGVSDIRARR